MSPSHRAQRTTSWNPEPEGQRLAQLTQRQSLVAPGFSPAVFELRRKCRPEGRRYIAQAGSAPAGPGALFNFVVTLVAAVVALAGSKEIRHDIGSRIAGMVQARQSESSLERFEQRKVRVELIALHTLAAVVGIYREQHLVRRGRYAVIVFVPHNHDGVLAFAPSGGIVNGGNQGLDGLIAPVHRARVKAGERAIVCRIERAYGTSIPAAVLVVALVRGDERKRWNMPGSKVGEQTALAFEIHHSAKAQFRVGTRLNVLEIGEGVVLHRIESDHICVRET